MSKNLNSRAAISKLTEPAPPPLYASTHQMLYLKRLLGLRVRWVKSVTSIDIGSAPGESVYDRSTLVIEANAPAETYLHELCHALIARAYRPTTWHNTPNFGCMGREEIEVCYLQIYLLDRWRFWWAANGEYDPVSLLNDYSFDLEIESSRFDPTYKADMLDLWRRVAKRGQTLARKLRIPLKSFPPRSGTHVYPEKCR